MSSKPRVSRKRGPKTRLCRVLLRVCFRLARATTVKAQTSWTLARGPQSGGLDVFGILLPWTPLQGPHGSSRRQKCPRMTMLSLRQRTDGIVARSRFVGTGRGFHREAYSGKFSRPRVTSSLRPDGDRKHMRQHVRPVVCPRCPFSAAEQRDVRRHVERAHNTLAKQLWEVNDPFACALCAQIFTRKDNLQRHYRRKHSAEDRWYL